MRRFYPRILVCLLPILISAVVVGWAWREYQQGRGGFRLGVDLVGGTILVYEVDESKLPEKFSAADLANALKRRIDPADLYNITIRPVEGTVPRVEIILPTGGQKQIEAEQRRWRALLTEMAKKYPVTDDIARKYGLNKEQREDPYGEVRVGGRRDLLDLVQKYYPKARGDDINADIDAALGTSSGGRRMLTSEEVENIKGLISKQGRLEFRILANRVDDADAIAAAEGEMRDARTAKDPKTGKTLAEELDDANKKAVPPPPPWNKDDGTTKFTVKLGGEQAHTYSWVEIGKSELYLLHLNSQALDALAQTNPSAFREIDGARKAPHGGTFYPPRSSNCLVYVRKITDWSRRLPKDRELGKEYEYFFLVRDPLPGEEVTGDFLTRAQESPFTKGGGERVIEFTFDGEGASRFYEVTSKNKPTGPKDNPTFLRNLAIVFDGQIGSAPVIRDAISTNGQISGTYTQQEVQDLVRILRAGALPATLKKEPVSQDTMSPTLGEDTTRKGTWAVGAAFVAVLAFMVLYYRFAGFVACVALFANLLLTVAFMVLVQAAFTLPGLCGLVLTLGMAVDANVLIYERLREEREKGASLALSLRNGYDRAFPTIIDTHLTSIFTAIVLYIVGNDQLKGFGISLTVGLIISLFTSLFMTRTLFDVWMAKGWLKDLRFGHLRFGRLDLHHAHFDFMAIRYYMFAATGLLTVLGAALFIYRADVHGGRATVLNIDFTGGTAYTGQLAKGKAMDITALRERLERDCPLPDPSVGQIFVTDEKEKDPPGTSRFFTFRTSERNLSAVQQFIQGRLGDDLKRVRLESVTTSRDHTRATLRFTDQTGKEPDLASPAQVQSFITKELERRDLTPGVHIEKAGEVHGDRATELRVTFGAPVAQLDDVMAEVKKAFNSSPQPERLENFDTQVAANTQERALYAILASWCAILLYLWFRFGSWTFGAAAVVCLVHDLFFTLGAIAGAHYLYGTWAGTLLGLGDFKLDLNSVAALLTLVGYSVSDTIVVFDRIREVRGKNPALTPKMINDSVNQTLGRTLLTALTVWLVVMVLYVFGGEGVKLFAFVMVVGVMVGTYSSIYVASPLLLIFGEGRTRIPERARFPQPAPAEG
jgi:SecD/SecF fusion protein